MGQEVSKHGYIGHPKRQLVGEGVVRVRAAHHGRSMEAELRAIVTEALEQDEERGALNLAEAIRRRFAPLGGVELEPHPPVSIGEPPDFGP
jgi:plasmid stability protein